MKKLIFKIASKYNISMFLISHSPEHSVVIAVKPGMRLLILIQKYMQDCRTKVFFSAKNTFFLNHFICLPPPYNPDRWMPRYLTIAEQSVRTQPSLLYHGWSSLPPLSSLCLHSINLSIINDPQPCPDQPAADLLIDYNNISHISHIGGGFYYFTRRLVV